MPVTRGAAYPTSLKTTSKSDFFFDRKPFSDNAAKVLSLCESGEIKSFITSVTISNIFFILRQTAIHEKVIEKLVQLVTVMEVLTTDRKVILKDNNCC